MSFGVSLSCPPLEPEADSPSASVHSAVQNQSPNQQVGAVRALFAAAALPLLHCCRATAAPLLLLPLWCRCRWALTAAENHPYMRAETFANARACPPLSPERRTRTRTKSRPTRWVHRALFVLRTGSPAALICVHVACPACVPRKQKGSTITLLAMLNRTTLACRATTTMRTSSSSTAPRPRPGPPSASEVEDYSLHHLSNIPKGRQEEARKQESCEKVSLMAHPAVVLRNGLP